MVGPYVPAIVEEFIIGFGVVDGLGYSCKVQGRVLHLKQDTCVMGSKRFAG